MNPEQLIRHFDLKPLEMEGGFFKETYRSRAKIPNGLLCSKEQKSISTAIYYCLTAQTFSSLHRLPTDEIYHFYHGDPVELFIMAESPQPHFEIHILGQDYLAGQIPQLTVPAFSWQGSRLVKGGKIALMGTTMAPGFDYDDFEKACYDKLKNLCPEADQWLKNLCDLTA